ncbi:MAG: transporter, ATP-binding protein [Anaerocolumna sp.]|jgi:ATP-binding cassette subfamily C protein|nr:transporter, ATP-binding protein [Anaerocolumna sp.]
MKKKKEVSNGQNKIENSESKKEQKYTVLENIKYILKNIRKYDKKLFVLFAIFTIISGISPFASILFPKFILDELVGNQKVTVLVWLLLGFFFCSSITGYFIAFLRGIFYPRAIKIRFKFIEMIGNKCMTTDFKNTENPSFLNSVETSFRALQSNDTGIEGVIHKLFALGSEILILLGYILIIGKLNVWILLYLIANVSITYYLTLRVKKYEYQRADDLSDIDRHVGYTYRLMYDFEFGKDMRIYGLTNWISSLFKKHKMDRYQIDKKIKYGYFKVGLVEVLFLLIREGLIYAYLIYQVLENGLGIGSFTMYFLSIANFANAMKVIFDDFAHISAQSLYINDFRTFIDSQEEKEPEEPKTIPQGPYTIEFKNVYFKYPGSDKYVYSDVSLKINAGEKLAIVGHNGAGKTTFVKLLSRMYEPESGEILLNGINIQEFSKTEYYTLFSAVFQEIKTTAFSVAENIAVSDEIVDESRIIECLEKADMKDKVLGQKNGIYTGMQKILDDEGVEFSGGENQRIILARALYKDAGIVILDEPTAALDALAEKSIYEKFNDMVKHKTSIFISHRLASTSFCDNIAMFEHGRLVEYGTHDELIQKGGKYADMFMVQAQYYKEDGNIDFDTDNNSEYSIA